MITVKDKDGKTQYIWTDESSEPVKINDGKKEKKDEASKEGKE